MGEKRPPGASSRSPWRFVGLAILWVAASAAIAIACAGLVAVTLDMAGVHRGAVGFVFDIVAVAVFLFAVGLPLMLRRRLGC